MRGLAREVRGEAVGYLAMSRNPAVRALNKWSRKLHRWGAILVLTPLILVITTGLLLQLKKQIPWVQPPTQRGLESEPSISFERILEIARSVPEARIDTWGDIDRLDFRPDRAIVKIRAKSHWEIQIDTSTDDILQIAYRRSDLIESLHDGSFFGDPVKLWIFLPTGIVLLCLWLTGVYLWFLPIVARRNGRIRRSRKNASGQ